MDDDLHERKSEGDAECCRGRRPTPRSEHEGSDGQHHGDSANCVVSNSGDANLGASGARLTLDLHPAAA